MHQLGVTKLLWQVIDEQVATLRTGDGASFSECRSIIRTKDVKEREEPTKERKKEKSRPSLHLDTNNRNVTRRRQEKKEGKKKIQK